MSRVIPADRARFDRLVDEVLETLPEAIVELFDEKPLVVEDRPSLEILREFGLDEAQSDEICGLHSGPMGRVPHLDGATDGATDGTPCRIGERRRAPHTLRVCRAARGPLAPILRASIGSLHRTPSWTPLASSG